MPQAQESTSPRDARWAKFRRYQYLSQLARVRGDHRRAKYWQRQSEKMMYRMRMGPFFNAGGRKKGQAQLRRVRLMKEARERGLAMSLAGQTIPSAQPL